MQRDCQPRGIAEPPGIARRRRSGGADSPPFEGAGDGRIVRTCAADCQPGARAPGVRAEWPPVDGPAGDR